MLNVTLDSHPDLYFVNNYRKGLDFLKGIKDKDYSYPAEITNFHVYTEFRNPKELLAIKSYLATQNLSKTKLIVWSDYDISDQENIQPYKDLVDFRVYNPRELAKGTPLEGVETHLETGGDHNHWMSSGVMRFLVLYKFGGVYFDMDMVLLRDFKPILGQNFAYQWGSSTDFAKERGRAGGNPWALESFGPCAALLGAVKGSLFIEDCMERLIATPPSGGTCYDEDMLAYVYAKRLFTVFPSTFFNTEWNTTDISLQNYWFEHPMQDPENLFLEAFAWHWHNSSNRNKEVVEGSKFDLLEQFIDQKLQERNLV